MLQVLQQLPLVQDRLRAVGPVYSGEETLLRSGHLLDGVDGSALAVDGLPDLAVGTSADRNHELEGVSGQGTCLALRRRRPGQPGIYASAEVSLQV